jgi:plasmid stabilization system protein ParE
MADNALLVKWDKPAFITFQKIYNHIRKYSPVNTEKVKPEILAITKSLADYPERYPPDKFNPDLSLGKSSNGGH